MNTHDLIAEAHRILSEPLVIPDTPDDERSQAEAEADAMMARVYAWANAAHSKLEALYHVTRAARARGAQYGEAIARLTSLQNRERYTADRCTSLAYDVLRAERPLAGLTDAEPYGVRLADGLAPKIVINPPSVVVDGVIPSEWERVVPERREPDKVRIKGALISGQTVPNCRLERTQRFDWGEPRRNPQQKGA